MVTRTIVQYLFEYHLNFDHTLESKFTYVNTLGAIHAIDAPPDREERDRRVKGGGDGYIGDGNLVRCAYSDVQESAMCNAACMRGKPHYCIRVPTSSTVVVACSTCYGYTIAALSLFYAHIAIYLCTKTLPTILWLPPSLYCCCNSIAGSFAYIFFCTCVTRRASLAIDLSIRLYIDQQR